MKRVEGVSKTAARTGRLPGDPGALGDGDPGALGDGTSENGETPVQVVRGLPP